MSVHARLQASPSFQDIEANWNAGKASVVFTVEAADLLTPVSAYLRLRNLDAASSKHTLLLESVEGGVSRGR